MILVYFTCKWFFSDIIYNIKSYRKQSYLHQNLQFISEQKPVRYFLTKKIKRGIQIIYIFLLAAGYRKLCKQNNSYSYGFYYTYAWNTKNQWQPGSHKKSHFGMFYLYSLSQASKGRRNNQLINQYFYLFSRWMSVGGPVQSVELSVGGQPNRW